MNADDPRSGAILLCLLLAPLVCAGQPPKPDPKPKPKPEPRCQVNYQGRDEEPAAERAWISANFPWAGRPAFEVQLDQTYYYSDEKEAFLLVRLNTQNLLANGTFEQDAWRRGWPDSWTKAHWETTRRHHLEPGNPKSVCLKLGEGLCWAAQEVKGLKAGIKYIVAFRAKTDEGKKASYQVLWDGDKSTDGQVAETQFKEYTVEFTPATDKPVTVKFWSGDFKDPASSGVGYFDRARLVAEGPDARPAWPFAASEVKSMKAKVTIVNTWAGKSEPVSDFTVEDLAPDTTETRPIPLGPLPKTKLGRSFKLTAELLDAAGKPVTASDGKPLTAVLTFGKIEPPGYRLEPIKKLEWSDDYACFINGKPFFPIMLYNWYDSEFTERDWKVDMAEMRKMGFNTVFLVDKSLEKVKAANLYFLMGRPGGYVEKPTHWKQPKLELLTNARQNFNEWLLAYGDGAEYDIKQADSILEQFKKDKAVDPDRPIIQCVQGPSPAKFAAYAKTAEIVWPEPHTHDGPFTVNFVQTALDKVREVRGKKAGAWIECATYSPYGCPLIWPSGLRERAYAALARGVRGIDWFAHHAHETDGAGRPCGRTKDMAPLTWSEMRGLLAELVYLTPALCAPDHPGVSASPDLLDVVRRDAGGKTYVIAAPSFWYFKTPEKAWKVPKEKWGRWDWEKGPDGRLAHKTTVGAEGKPASHGYYFGKIYAGLQKGDKLLQDVFIDPAAGKVDALTSVFVAYAVQGDYYGLDWNHRACWAAQETAAKLCGDPKAPMLNAGELPEAGKWITLEVDAADVGLVGTNINNYNNGRNFAVQGAPGATVWWGKSLIKKADGKTFECFIPLVDERVTIAVEGLKPTSTVVSLLDGRVLPVENGTFRDKFFRMDETGMNDREVRIYEITF
jgi:hypothetical protein